MQLGILKHAKSKLRGRNGFGSKVVVKILGVLGANQDATAAGTRRKVRKIVVVKTIIDIGLGNGLCGAHQYLKGTIETGATSKVIGCQRSGSVLVVESARNECTNARTKAIKLEAQRHIRWVDDKLGAEVALRHVGVGIPSGTDGALQVGVRRHNERQWVIDRDAEVR